MRFVKIAIILLVLAGCIGAGAIWLRGRSSSDAPAFRTAPVQRADVVVTIAATGTVEPEEVVDVGAQVTGKITEFGKDVKGRSIDYGSELTQNQLLAKIDDTLYVADLASAQSQLDSAKAGVTRAIADLAQMQAKYSQTERDWKRAQSLGPSDALSQVDFDTYQSNYEVAKANVGVGAASVDQAKTSVAQAEAAMTRAKQNVAYCTINSPVSGTVIARRVNVGQTVVSNLSASSLFLLAKDLKQMQVWVPVNEADIGSIRPGQPVTFTCDTYAGETFRGTMSKVRLNAASTQNVITYTCEVDVDNSSGRLLPYMSANVLFETDRRDKVLTIPNSALRFEPREELLSLATKNQLAAAQTSPAASDPVEAQKPQSSDATSRPAANGNGAGQHRRGGSAGGDGNASGGGSRGGRGARREASVWVADGEFVKPIRVRLGITDGVNTEVVAGELVEGQEIVIGETRADTSSTAAGSETRNPFMPQFPRRPGGGGGGGGGGGRTGGGGGGR